MDSFTQVYLYKEFFRSKQSYVHQQYYVKATIRISRKFDWKNVGDLENKFIQWINLTIAQDHSIIFSIIQKTWRIKFGELHKKLPTAKFNFMSNFLLITQYTKWG